MRQRRLVAVATFHRCINHGSYWQARCLVEGLRARGCEAVLLDHRSRRATLAEWKCALRPTLPTPVPAADRPHYRRKLEKFDRAVADLPLSPPFDLGEPVELDAFEAVVVGSDEVWNLSHPWYGGQPFFFGEGLIAERLVSYAASFGNYDAAWGLHDSWSRLLGRFRELSVRDDNSRRLVAAATGREPAVVLDPVLQFPPQLDGKDPGGSDPAELSLPDEPYVAVYGHNFSVEFAHQVRQWAREHGRTLVSISYRNDWADRQWLDAGPHDFAAAVASADAVATNFFHGCVFALVTGTRFVCEPTPYRSTKIRSLISMIGADRHLVQPGAPPAAVAAALASAAAPAVGETLGVLRERSTSYLDAALG